MTTTAGWRGRGRPTGLDPGPGPRQFNKLGGVWIFLISPAKLDGRPRVIVLPKRPPQKEPRPPFYFFLSFFFSVSPPSLSLSLSHTPFFPLALILKVQTRALPPEHARLFASCPEKCTQRLRPGPPGFNRCRRRLSVSRLQSSSVWLHRAPYRTI